MQLILVMTYVSAAMRGHIALLLPARYVVSASLRLVRVCPVVEADMGFCDNHNCLTSAAYISQPRTHYTYARVLRARACF